MSWIRIVISDVVGWRREEDVMLGERDRDRVGDEARCWA